MLMLLSGHVGSETAATTQGADRDTYYTKKHV